MAASLWLLVHAACWRADGAEVIENDRPTAALMRPAALYCRARGSCWNIHLVVLISATCRVGFRLAALAASKLARSSELKLEHALSSLVHCNQGDDIIMMTMSKDTIQTQAMRNAWYTRRFTTLHSFIHMLS